MKINLRLVAGLVVVLLAGCTSGKPDPSSSARSSSATPSASPSAAASASPSPSVSPMPETIQVFGQVGFRVVQASGSERLRQPIGLSLVLFAQLGGEEVRIPLEKGGRFSASLRPGTYQVRSLTVRSPGLGKKDVDLDTILAKGSAVKDLRFTVPDSGCLYVGRMAFSYLRLPRGTFNQQLQILGTLAPSAASEIKFLTSGSFVYFLAKPGSHVISLPPVDQRPAEAGGCAAVRVRYVSVGI